MAPSIGGLLRGVRTAKGLALTKSRNGVGHSEGGSPGGGVQIHRADMRSSMGGRRGCSNKSPTRRGTEAKTWNSWSQVYHEYSREMHFNHICGAGREGHVLGAKLRHGQSPGNYPSGMCHARAPKRLAAKLFSHHLHTVNAATQYPTPLHQGFN
jgi:hypothetical protein